MTILLSESDVKSILTMPLALEAVDDSFKRLADGTAQSRPSRVIADGERVHAAVCDGVHHAGADDA